MQEREETHRKWLLRVCSTRWVNLPRCHLSVTSPSVRVLGTFASSHDDSTRFKTSSCLHSLILDSSLSLFDLARLPLLSLTDVDWSPSHRSFKSSIREAGPLWEFWRTLLCLCNHFGLHGLPLAWFQMWLIWESWIVYCTRDLDESVHNCWRNWRRKNANGRPELSDSVVIQHAANLKTSNLEDNLEAVVQRSLESCRLSMAAGPSVLSVKYLDMQVSCLESKLIADQRPVRKTGTFWCSGSGTHHLLIHLPNFPILDLLAPIICKHMQRGFREM